MFLFVIFINCIQLYNNQIHKNKGIYLYKDSAKLFTLLS